MKRRLIKPLLFCLLLSLLTVMAKAQTSEIVGVVKDEAGRTLLGASIQLLNKNSGKRTGVSTKEDGKFIFSGLAPQTKYRIDISYFGYQNKHIDDIVLKPSEQSSLLIELIPKSAIDLDQVVVVGYGTTKKRELTGAITSIKASELKDQPVANFEQAIAGKLAGVQVIQNTGAPGGAITVRVRGLSSITAGSEPLYVVDGFPISNDAKDIQTYLQPNTNVLNNQYQKTPNTMSSLNMDDVESIEILKDASAASIYGSRGSGGVVLITTKRGTQDGKTKINYNAYYGVQEVEKKLKMMDAYQWATMNREGKINAYLDQNRSKGVDYAAAAKYVDNTPPNPNSAFTLPNEVKPYLAGQPGLTNTNWQDAVFRKTPTQNHTLSASGGNEKVQYYISGNYMQQDGIMIGSAFNKMGLMSNIKATLTPKLRIGVLISPTRMAYDLINSEGGWFQEGIINIMLKTSPIFPVYNADGSYAVDRQNTWNKTAFGVNNYGITSGENPVALANLIKDKLLNIRVFSNAFAEYDIIPKLTFKTFFGSDILLSNRNYFHPSTLGYSNLRGGPIASGNPANNIAFSQSGNAINWLWENTLNYNFTIKEHKLNILGGYTMQKYNSAVTFASANNFPFDAVQTLNAGTPTAGTSDGQAWSLLSYIGRLNYSFKDRYFFTGTFRTDGSSRFGANNKWGVFPSASASWDISREEFMSNLKFLNQLKLRVSYGLTGNFQIPNFASYATMGSNLNYVFGEGTGTTVIGASTNVYANPNLKWEKTGQTNIGLDIDLLKNRLSFTIDAYRSITSDLLLQVPVGLSSGLLTSLQNRGKIENKGLEFAINSVNIDKGEKGLKWNTTFNIYANRNKVLALGPDGSPIISSGGVAQCFITQVGSPVGNYYGYIAGGVIQTQEKLDAYQKIYKINTDIPQFGDRYYEDVNGDGVIDANDRTIMGNVQPKFAWGLNNTFNYRNFDLSIALQGVQGGQIFNLQRRYIYNNEGNMNSEISSFENRYIDQQHPGDGQTIRANRTSNASSQAVNSTFVEDGSFIRLRSIILGYAFKPELFKNAIKGLRVYVSGQNLKTWTKYLFYNPEASARPGNALSQGEDYGSYPLSRTFTFGLNVTF